MTWKIIDRPHKRPGFVYVVNEAGDVWQMSPSGRVFTTGVKRGGATRVVHARLTDEYYRRLKESGMTARKCIEFCLDVMKG